MAPSGRTFQDRIYGIPENPLLSRRVIQRTVMLTPFHLFPQPAKLCSNAIEATAGPCLERAGVTRGVAAVGPETH